MFKLKKTGFVNSTTKQKVNMSIEETLFNETFVIVSKIAASKYKELELEGKLKRISTENILDELTVCGGNIDFNEKEYRDSFEYMQITNTNRFMTYLDLWIDDERSDLTLICEIELDETGNIRSSVIEDLHVL